MRLKKGKNETGWIVLLSLGVVISFFALIFWIIAKLFEYNLWVLFGKDAPWWVDLLGGMLLPVNFSLALLLWLLTDFVGFVTPIFPGH